MEAIIMENDLCYYCGQPYGTKIHNNVNLLERTIDHIIPISRGGLNIPENKVYCHLSCNKLKGKKTLTEWRDVLMDALSNTDDSGIIIKKKSYGYMKLFRHEILREILKRLNVIIEEKSSDSLDLN